MSTSRNYQAQGIVLKQSKFGESDKLITLYTQEFGKLRAIAKGACRPKSKLGGNVEPLTYSLMLLARGRNLDIITQAQTINGFLTLKSDLWRMARGLYILELTDAFTVDGSENRPLFDLLLAVLTRLNDPDSDEPALLRYFELHLLDRVGYRPQLRRCVTCDLPLKPVVNFFSPAKGGMLCSSCESEQNRGDLAEPTWLKRTISVSVEALKVLRLWQSCDYATAKRVKLRPELSLELEQLLHEYITYILQRELRSLTWLKALKREIAAPA